MDAAALHLVEHDTQTPLDFLFVLLGELGADDFLLLAAIEDTYSRGSCALITHSTFTIFGKLY